MDPTGNSYDAATNTMTVGTIDSCLATPVPNPATHTHTAHLIVENVEDMVGWQVRLNYNGDEMRPGLVDFDPFLDTTTAQEISFVNLPKTGVANSHRDIVIGMAIPSAAPGPQSALVGAVYNYAPDAAVSPDTPAKNPPDDSSYAAPNGGVLAALDLEVSGDQSGRTLLMQVDDANPNPPGSAVQVFNGYGLTAIDISESALSSGYHAEGAESCSPVPTPRNLVADVGFANVVVTAPPSVRAYQYFDVHFAGTIENRGPDETDAIGYVAFGLPEKCFGYDQHYIGTIKIQPLSRFSFEDSERFFCHVPPGGTASKTFQVKIYTTTIAIDPNPNDNVWAAEVVVNVVEPSPAPTPTPGGPIEQPSNTPGGPTPGPVTPTPVGGTPGSVPVLPAALPAAGDPASANQPQAVLVARGLPSTGKLAADDTPGLAQFLITVIALGLPTAAGVGIHRLIARRP